MKFPNKFWSLFSSLAVSAALTGCGGTTDTGAGDEAAVTAPGAEDGAAAVPADDAMPAETPGEAAAPEAAAPAAEAEAPEAAAPSLPSSTTPEIEAPKTEEPAPADEPKADDAGDK